MRTTFGLLVALVAAASPTHVRSAPPTGARPLVVVVEASSELTEFSSSQLRRLFQHRGVLAPDGSKLIPLNLPPRHPVRVRFDATVLNLDPEQVGRYWIDRKIRGEGGPPPVVASPELIARFVRSVPNTVAYLPLPVPAGLRVLRIDGHSPEEADYPLQVAP